MHIILDDDDDDAYYTYVARFFNHLAFTHMVAT